VADANPGAAASTFRRRPPTLDKTTESPCLYRIRGNRGRISLQSHRMTHDRHPCRLAVRPSDGHHLGMEPIFLHLAVALGLGLLVGVQRERAEDPLAGIRTFPLITILGGLLAELSVRLDATWIFAVGLLSLAAVLATGYAITGRTGRYKLGLTTEIAALYMYIVGAFVVT